MSDEDKQTASIHVHVEVKHIYSTLPKVNPILNFPTESIKITFYLMEEKCLENNRILSF